MAPDSRLKEQPALWTVVIVLRGSAARAGPGSWTVFTVRWPFGQLVSFFSDCLYTRSFLCSLKAWCVAPSLQWAASSASRAARRVMPCSSGTTQSGALDAPVAGVTAPLIPVTPTLVVVGGLDVSFGVALGVVVVVVVVVHDF